MNLKEKIDAEQQDRPLVLLYMEGMFWKAYEQSAMRFTKEIKAYKLQKRFFKNVNSEVVSLGFPDGSLQDVLKGREFTRINEKQISFFLNTAFTADEFEDWKKALPLETDPDKLRMMRASINSYLGIMQHFCTLNIKRKILGRCSQIFLYGYFGNAFGKFSLYK